MDGWKERKKERKKEQQSNKRMTDVFLLAAVLALSPDVEEVQLLEQGALSVKRLSSALSAP